MRTNTDHLRHMFETIEIFRKRIGYRGVRGDIMLQKMDPRYPNNNHIEIENTEQAAQLREEYENFCRTENAHQVNMIDSVCYEKEIYDFMHDSFSLGLNVLFDADVESNSAYLSEYKHCNWDNYSNPQIGDNERTHCFCFRSFSQDDILNLGISEYYDKDMFMSSSGNMEQSMFTYSPIINKTTVLSKYDVAHSLGDSDGDLNVFF